MGIYPSLFVTLLALVIAPPILAATNLSFTPHTDIAVSSPPIKNISNLVSALVNINTVDGETLAAELKGIGLKRAKAILDYRNAHGPFKSIDDLAKIKGISKKIVEQNRAKITI